MSGVAAALGIFVVTLAAFIILQYAEVVTSRPGTAAPERVPFTGGGVVETHAWNRFHVRYYPMSLLFLAFDMEMVFMYPWAVVFLDEGAIAFVEMLMFIVILLFGILYIWRERALEWA
jgi:NADH:ubiquinone oxidoreductase subunit 3 (subunit A)